MSNHGNMYWYVGISPCILDLRHVTIGQWQLNFKWRMEGIDVQCDPSIGNQLTALANTLTALTGADDDIADLTSVNEQQEGSSTDALSDQVSSKHLIEVWAAL